MERQPALDPSTATFGVPLHLPLLENAQHLSRGGAGTSADDVILISSDDESDDDLDEGRSDIYFESLDRLLQNARNRVKFGRVTGTGKGVDAGSNDSDAPEPLVSSNAGPESQGEVSLNGDNDILLDGWEAEDIIGEEFYDDKPHYRVRL
ncbi:NAD-dependent deacetylase hst3 [Podospora pseudoanserina]|uniref:NAD-dependent deacetylase hst3 n=1 Tax=Podospora pseudoanserina TaxID=2609844 RepID=A0ABR0I9I8_9PEZI|nr:NAD-dependent deacetylase hst3 [Podospora pseudoanserina]